MTHTSLNQEQVNSIIRVVAAAQGASFAVTARMLEMRWALMARDRIRANMSSAQMWEEMVEMARRATP